MAVLLTYFFLEIGYRVITYQQQVNGFEKGAFWWVDRTFYESDAIAGYAYSPNTIVRHTLTDFKDAGVIGHDVHINSAGRISRFDDAAPDEPDIYRVALIGDSFTAGAFTGTPPGDVLETRLNELSDLKAEMNIERFDVLNFGMEAIGLAQFVTIYETRVKAYAPDVIFVNFISDDMRRRFIWRGETSITTDETRYRLHLNCFDLPVSIDNAHCLYSTPIFAQSQGMESDFLTQLRIDLYNSDVGRRPWFGLYPELLAQTIGYRAGVMPRLDNSHPALSNVQDNATALETSHEAFTALQDAAPRVFFLHVPVHTDIINGEIDPLAAQFINENPQFDIRQMRFALPPADEDTVRSWYNLPFDGHFNDRGSELFAEVMLASLKGHLAETQNFIFEDE